MLQARQTVISMEAIVSNRWCRIGQSMSCRVAIWLPVVVLFTSVVDGSTAVAFLVTSNGDLDAEQIFQLYQKRWKVEESHKSVKQNAGIAQSPTKMERSQKNHLFAAMWGLVQLEKLKIAHRMNHFALKHKIYLKALKAAWSVIKYLKCHTVNELYSPSF